jgi:hypothetical protein
MDMPSNLPLLLLLPLALILAGLWYIIKNVIRRNGYPSDPLRQHTRDIANLRNLVTWEKNPARKRNFTFLLAGFYVALTALVMDFLIYLGSFFL